ncbi:MAG: HAD family hydrolase [Spirochaetaceae bacterium]|jgi:phosphoglycolate phosphatase/putative hydrolase of the HAD superfamily|nr:HAD family hydrolase [Spirochaetaceae bacterium]
MKIYAVPPRVDAVLFDMDSTLYTNERYAAFQRESLIRRFAERRGLPFEAALSEVEAYQSAWGRARGGAQISLGNTFRAFGISIKESAAWREELYEPSLFLAPDRRLKNALEALKGPQARGRALVVITNNPVLVAQKTLAALGAADCFSVILGLDSCMVSKPHEAPFLKAAELCGAETGSCLAVGDRYDLDIAVPLRLGMGGILVDGVEDIYRLPALKLPAGGRS